MNDENIVLIARLKVKKEAVEAAKTAALAIIEDSRRESGCLNYDFHQAIDDETLFVWHETWKDQTVVDAHARSPHFVWFSERIKDLTDEPLQVTFTKMVSEKAALTEI